MGFTVGEHSARHMRRILRIYLASWGLAGLTHAAELALTELVANVVRHVPGRSCSVLILCGPQGLRWR
ncbi:putative regulatory protein [Actinobacteria bacterium OV450]|nr:putative regulatory protein [Actinobacteria bacterium OV450]